MYLWNIRSLKSDLAARPLTEREQLPYLVVSLLLFTVGSLVPTDTDNVWDVLGAVWTVLLTGAGTIYLFGRNGGRSGSHFLQRYFSIGLVVGIRWTVAILFISFAYYILLEMVGAAPAQTTWPQFLFIAVAEVLLYVRLGKHIHEVATASAQPEQVQEGAT